MSLSPGLTAGAFLSVPTAFEPSMAFHKYKIGQRVSYRPSRSNFPVRCVVTALLPARDIEFKYRIRREGASEDSVVDESELREARDR